MSAPRRTRRHLPTAAADQPAVAAPRGLEAFLLEAGGAEFAVLEWPARRPVLPATLTPAERAVAALAIAGLANREIARRRGVAARTVANQLAAVFQKLGVGSRSELTARAMG